jgi:general stress protein CsbA
LLHDLFNWLQTVPGAVDGDPSTSWSGQLGASLHFWSLLEATHVVTLMLFAGTILVVDLRMLGLAFRSTPYSTLNNRVLPMTIIGFVVLVLTGILLFASEPLKYYHSVWFRAKMIFLAVAAINIFWFHFRTQKTMAAWDTMESPPAPVKLAAAVSITSWILVILFGRLIAFTWFDCGSTKPGSFAYGFAACEAAMRESIAAEKAAAEAEKAAAEETPAAGESPAETPTPEETPTPAASPGKKGE